MTEKLTLVLTAATFGQIALALCLLAVKNASQPANQPLIWFFAALGCLLIQPLAKAFLPEAELYSILLMLPALLLLAPLLWLYVLGMTAAPGSVSHPRKWPHFVLAIAGLIVSTLTALLPRNTLHALLATEDAQMSYYVGILMILAFLLVLSWLAQSLFYVIRIINRINRYHRLLNDHYANNESRKLNWMLVVCGLLIAIWLTAALAVFVDNVFGVKIVTTSGATLMALIWVWSLSIFAIFQEPGFEEELLNETPSDEMDQNEEKKYQRSALDKSHSQRIAQKLEELMETQQVYLDPSISLTKLASLTGISSNYVSQTLNETLGQSFFDYINSWRIRHAKPLLLGSEKSILEIAFEVGFNARSSFYKSFKQFTQQTPSQFRRENKLH
ncbi:helix-turn-helix domain-containing protein [Aliiglaciecola sp. M165]|uniref:helix-turn-helix domain-containing protein n=1 Tax=Aliiglaciecola sp. M165 TaxID=2593649 RepID=UPI00117EAC90|nr:AraC family transcriptional regulator [Aliiglaciecola sp. M165]TRY33171.1 helix-turn-helix domain-containing protein [Aliiglaciecola sp. M165]